MDRWLVDGYMIGWWIYDWLMDRWLVDGYIISDGYMIGWWIDDSLMDRWLVDGSDTAETGYQRAYYDDILSPSFSLTFTFSFVQFNFHFQGQAFAVSLFWRICEISTVCGLWIVRFAVCLSVCLSHSSHVGENQELTSFSFFRYSFKTVNLKTTFHSNRVNVNLSFKRT